MATAAGAVNGIDVIFSVDGDPVGCAKTNTLNVSRAEVSTTCKQSGGTEEISLGALSWGGSGENIMLIGSTVSWEDFYNLLLNKTKFEMEFGTNVTGDKVFKGFAYLTSYSLTANDTDTATFSYDFKGTGPLTLFTLTAPRA